MEEEEEEEEGGKRNSRYSNHSKTVDSMYNSLQFLNIVTSHKLCTKRNYFLIFLLLTSFHYKKDKILFSENRH